MIKHAAARLVGQKLGEILGQRIVIGLFAPVGTPATTVSRVDQVVSQALQDDSLRKRMNDVGINPEHIGQAPFVARTRSDTARYDQVIRQTGIRVEP